MTDSSRRQITQLLVDWSNGDQAALDRLMPLVYEELRRLARHYMRNERAGHTLQTTALVNEAYLRLADYKQIQWRERAHFFAIAAQIMRRILVEHARAHNRAKRDGGAIKVPLDEVAVLSQQRGRELIALDDALTNLAASHPRKCRVVEMRYFAGLNNEEIAEVLGVKPNTVIRDWTFAKAWLHRELYDSV